MVPSKHNNNLVLVQQISTTEGQWGNTDDWVDFKQVWVSINPNRGREVFASDELESVVTHTVRGDFLELEGITAKMRLVYNDSHSYSPVLDGSTVFEILAVMPDLDHHRDIMIQVAQEGRTYSEMPQ